MRVISAKAINFASYKQLKFDFSNQGLTLIAGPTGSGKSTLCDLIPWTLFGKTAKGGAVSEVLAWPGNEVTTSTIQLETVTITRCRGPNAKDNDLYYYFTDSKIHRGKDLLDTQKLINTILGMDYELYLSGSYYHEFSQTAQFFTTTAKNRRAICEQLVDLTLAKTLQSKLSDKIKETNKSLEKTKWEMNSITSSLGTLEKMQVSENTKAANWTINHQLQIKRVTANYDDFEKNRKKVVSKKCNSCGTVLAHPKEVVNTNTNPFLAHLAALEIETNPHTGSVKDYTDAIAGLENDLDSREETRFSLEQQIEEDELLQQVTEDFRSLSITNTIKDVEYKTNQILTDYFDAELKVSFEIQAADKLEVTITKDGNLAAYTQLSKGQRCLLKLSFGISVMEAVANHHGKTFHQIFLDEALDGLDDNMKVKAYRLLETICNKRESVFVVEHSSALKELFINSYSVSRTSEGSTIAKTE